MIRTSLLAGLAAVTKILTLLALNKVLAIYVGPAGYAALGQFQNFVQMTTTFASGAINTGVVKYTAQHHGSDAAQQAVWRTAGSISLLGSALAAILLFTFNKSLALWLLNDEKQSDIFSWFAGTLILLVFNGLLLAMLNGKKETVKYVSANISGSIVAFTVTALLSITLGLRGALIALVIHQSLTFFVTLWICLKTEWFRITLLLGRIDPKTAVGLAKFTAMALVSAACIPLTHIVIRNHLGDTFGWTAAGYWEAMWRLSAAYLMLVTTTLSIYYLPRLSELTEPSAIRREIVQGYKFFVPIAAACGLTIFLAREPIIRTLFSAEFIEMEPLFAWQLIGDTIKIMSWLLGYVLTAKAFALLFIASEIIFSVLFVSLTYILTSFFGLEGTSIAHALNYLAHLAFMYLALRMNDVI